MISKEIVLKQINILIKDGDKVLSTKHYEHSDIFSGHYVDSSLFNKWESKIKSFLSRIEMFSLEYIEFKEIKEKSRWVTNAGLSSKYLDFIISLKESIESDIIYFEDKSRVVSPNINVLDSIVLHDALKEQVLDSFKTANGNYADVVFSAFRNIEDYVRDKGEYTKEDLYGTGLMQKAFHKENGNLTNLSDKEAERDGLRNLFAGAMGFVKNPKSHRRLHVDYNEALELLMFANYLLKIVDKNAEIKLKDSLFICKDSIGSYGECYYKNKKITILKGAKINSKIARSLKNTKLLDKLKSDNKLTLEGNFYILHEDIKNIAPSEGSKLILGTSSNGWNYWKNKDGKTLDEVYRG